MFLIKRCINPKAREAGWIPAYCTCHQCANMREAWMIARSTEDMTQDEQEAKSVRYTRAARVVLLDSGNYGVFNDSFTELNVVTEAELPAAIKSAAIASEANMNRVRGLYEAASTNRSRPAPARNSTTGPSVTVTDPSQLGF